MNLRWVVSNMHKGNAINALSQKKRHILSLGRMTIDLAIEEFLYNSSIIPMNNPLTHTWRYIDIAFPTMRETGALP